MLTFVLLWRHLYVIHLTHCGLVIPYGDVDLGQHWLSKWLVAWPHPTITWSQCWRRHSTSSLHVCYISFPSRKAAEFLLGHMAIIPNWKRKVKQLHWSLSKGSRQFCVLPPSMQWTHEIVDLECIQHVLDLDKHGRWHICRYARNGPEQPESSVNCQHYFEKKIEERHSGCVKLLIVWNRYEH